MDDSTFLTTLGDISGPSLIMLATSVAALTASHFAIQAPVTALRGVRRVHGHPAPRAGSKVTTTTVCMVGILLALIMAAAPLSLMGGFVGGDAAALNVVVLTTAGIAAARNARETRRHLRGDPLKDHLEPIHQEMIAIRAGLKLHHLVGAFGAAAATATIAYLKAVEIRTDTAMAATLVVTATAMSGFIAYVRLADQIEPLPWLVRSYLAVHRKPSRHRARGVTTLLLDPAVVEFLGRRQARDNLLRAVDVRLLQLVKRHAEPDRSAHLRACSSLLDEYGDADPESDVGRKALLDLVVPAITGRLPSSQTDARHVLGCNRPRWLKVGAVLSVAPVVAGLASQLIAVIPQVTG